MIERVAHRFKSGRLAIVMIERRPSRMIKRARQRARQARQARKIAAE
jgi:transcriptional regulator